MQEEIYFDCLEHIRSGRGDFPPATVRLSDKAINAPLAAALPSPASRGTDIPVAGLRLARRKGGRGGCNESN